MYLPKECFCKLNHIIYEYYALKFILFRKLYHFSSTFYNKVIRTVEIVLNLRPSNTTEKTYSSGVLQFLKSSDLLSRKTG